MSEKQRKVIMSKAVGAKWERQFFLEVQEAILDGWRVADNNSREDVSMRNFRGRIGRVVFYKEGEETETVETTEPEKEETVTTPEPEKEEESEPEKEAEKEEVETPEPEKEEESEPETKEEESEESKEKEEVAVDKAAILEEIEKAPKRKDLVVVAEKHNLKVDDNLKHPTALRNALIAQLND